MTKKDYKLIAEILFDSALTAQETLDLAEDFARRLERQNPKFDREKFIKDCLGE
jgi:hypothetical protein